MTVLSARGRQVIRESVARAVKAVVRAGARVEDLATKYDLSAGTVRRWVEGDGYPSFTVARRIAPLVGVDPETGRAA